MNIFKFLALAWCLAVSLPAPAQERSFQEVRLAYAAANAGYSLPNLRTRKSHEDYLKAFAEFAKATPSGYEIYGADADLQSGLKFVIYKPISGPGEQPWILSLTGTENVIDWVNNLDLGRPQLIGLKKIVTLFTHGFTSDKVLLVTGHSLGGALAQAAAHEIQKERVARGITDRKIKLITFNGFGAQELIAKLSDFRPELAGQMEIANYFVRGDLVSQIGHHFGSTYELIPPASVAGSGLARTLEYHGMKLIGQLLTAEQIAAAAPVAPPFSKSLNTISKVSGVLAYLNGEIHEFRQLWLVRWLCSVLDQVQTPEQLAAQKPAYMFLYNVGVTERARLLAEKHPDKANDFVRLKKSLERFYTLVR